MRVLKFLLLGYVFHWISGTDRDLPDGDLFSMCFGFVLASLRWCIGSVISVLGRSATFFMVK